MGPWIYWIARKIRGLAASRFCPQSDEILVAVSPESFLNCLLELRLENLRPSQLANLLGRFADRQVAGSSLAVLGLSVRGKTESLACGLVCFLFCHDCVVLRIFEGPEFNEAPKIVQG